MKLRTIGLIITLALGLLAAPLPTEAQKAGMVYSIGFLDFRLRSTTTDPRFIALRQGLRELGYVEGQNLVLEYRSAKGKRKRLPEVAAELVRLKVDIIVTSGSNRVWRAAKQATRTIPIVLAGIRSSDARLVAYRLSQCGNSRSHCAKCASAIVDNQWLPPPDCSFSKTLSRLKLAAFWRGG